MNKSTVSGFIVVGLIALLFWYFWGQETWTLMVCKEKLNDAECYNNNYVIDGFKTQKECMLEGVSKFSKEGFECGKNCKENEYGLRVCKEICNSAGCSE